ncbi:hypothetical protein BJ944DRAFT_244583 [Cunninghamella echinulata]|nr:hypothetical protein BJ944DRAFT_244583 [Cunninghamella echinulata]
MAGEDTVVNFVIGVFVSLGASFMDALGLNILKLDHVKEGNKIPENRRGDCGRPLWHIGLYTYIASQLIGSTIALNYLKTQWVAPLGSVALIYNFIFAKILVGTNITRTDVVGTLVVVASVIWIVVFGGMYNGDDPEESISLENLKTLFTRPIFIIYFSALNIITFSGLALTIWSNWIFNNESKKDHYFNGINPKKMRKMIGLMFSLDGGLLASETLLLAKSGVKLFTLSVSSQVNQFTDNTSRFIILALIITAVLQVYCLNTALKLYTSVVVVPVFYGTYTALGLVNTIIYLDEISNYPGWAIFLVFLGIAVLIYGVYLLSSKPDPTSQHDYNQNQQQENDPHNTIVNLSPSSSTTPSTSLSPPLSGINQEMHSITPTASTSTSSTTTTTPPKYIDDDNKTILISDDKAIHHNEKLFFTTLTSPPPIIPTRQTTSLSDTMFTTSTFNTNKTTSSSPMDLKLQQQQSFISASIIDDTIHERCHTTSKKSWVKRLISTALPPWKSFHHHHHQREDTFLSLHSTDATTSTTVSASSITTTTTTTTNNNNKNNNIMSDIHDPHCLTRRMHRSSHISESSDKDIEKNS